MKMEKKIYFLAIVIVAIGALTNGCIKSSAKVEKAKININSAKGAEDDSGMNELTLDCNNKSDSI